MNHTPPSTCEGTQKDPTIILISIGYNYYHHNTIIVTLSIYDCRQYAIKTGVLEQSTHGDVLHLISSKLILVDQHAAEPLLCDVVGCDSHVQGDGLASAGIGNRV